MPHVNQGLRNFEYRFPTLLKILHEQIPELVGPGCYRSACSQGLRRAVNLEGSTFPYYAQFYAETVRQV